VSRDPLLARVHRSLIHLDDDRTLRRDVLEQVRRTVPFDAFAWMLTDPETTVGTAPLAEVPAWTVCQTWWHFDTPLDAAGLLAPREFLIVQ
jgi:hypothetical protein